jgi:hypothetical protein
MKIILYLIFLGSLAKFSHWILDPGEHSIGINSRDPSPTSIFAYISKVHWMFLSTNKINATIYKKVEAIYKEYPYKEKNIAIIDTGLNTLNKT